MREKYVERSLWKWAASLIPSANCFFLIASDLKIKHCYNKNVAKKKEIVYLLLAKPKNPYWKYPMNI